MGTQKSVASLVCPLCVKRSQTQFLTFSLHISKMMCLGKDDLFYILNICLFHKSLKYFLNEKQEGQHRDYFALIYETGNKNECLMKAYNEQRVTIENILILKSATSDF